MMVTCQIEFTGHRDDYPRESTRDSVTVKLSACPHEGDYISLNDDEAAYLVKTVFICQKIVIVRVR